MYRTPQKNRWYRKIAHHRPLYRYGAVIIMIFLLLIGWRYGLYIWLNAAIMQEQATILQLQQQLLQQTVMERQKNELIKQLLLLKNSCADGTSCSIGTQSCDQCSYIFGAAQRAGLSIGSYQTSAVKKKSDWKSSQFITICLH